MTKKSFEDIYRLIENTSYTIVTNVPTTDFMNNTYDQTERFNSIDIKRVGKFEEFIIIYLTKNRAIYLPYENIIMILSKNK